MDVPSGCFAESVPEVMEGREIPGFHCDHSVVCRAPDVSIFRDYLHILGQVLLELFPASGRFLLVSLCQGSHSIEDQECEYHRTTPWLALIEPLG